MIGDAIRELALQPGAPADLMVLDRNTLDHDLNIDSDDDALVVHGATRRSMSTLYVAGRATVRDGSPTGIDLPAVQAELDAHARHGATDHRDWRHVADQWAQVLRGRYAAGHRRAVSAQG